MSMARNARHPGLVVLFFLQKKDLRGVIQKTYADYSHGMRVVSGVMDVDGGKLSVVEVLQRTELAELISAEGTLAHCSYLDFHAQALQS